MQTTEAIRLKFLFENEQCLRHTVLQGNERKSG